MIRQPNRKPDFGIDLYFSGTSFFTLGLGDVVPRSGVGRALTVNTAKPREERRPGGDRGMSRGSGRNN